MSSAESTRGPASLPHQRFRPGDVISERYELLDCIGSGAMGAVYRAHDQVLDADVAVKLIRVDPERADRDRATQRLLLEARAIARISHPGIVRVFDFGCTDAAPFIVMELLEGETLSAVQAREGVLSPELAIQKLLPIADAVHVAHRRGVVHRDIKPENVFLSRDELGRTQPKLVDFGVARFRERGRALTRPGMLMGTPDYMAPEQARAEPDVDQRADVWAFGVVLYELVTGRRPFAQQRPSYLAVLQAIVSEQPTPTLELGVGDAALWAILEKSLAKSRSERWLDLRQMGTALARWLLDRGISEDACGVSLRTHWIAVEPSQRETKRLLERGLEPPTLRRTDADAAMLSGDTQPPPALSSPDLERALAVRREDARSRRPAPRVPGTTFGRTLESASLQRLSRLQVGVVSALSAAVVTAALGWAFFDPQPPGAVTPPRADEHPRR